MTAQRQTESLCGPLPPAEECEALLSGRHREPHRLLGAHPVTAGERRGTVLRVYHPEARAIHCLLADGLQLRMRSVDERGLFSLFLPERQPPIRYRLLHEFRDGQFQELNDPYAFLPTLGELDQHLIGEGRHYRLWNVLGAHSRIIDGVEGVAFAVWATAARAVSVVGDFCFWDGRSLLRRSLVRA